MPPIRVLFIHGLESSPKGTKVRLLREQGFEVIAPDMQMGLLQLARRNSALRQVLRLGEARLAAAAVVGVALVGHPLAALGLAAGFLLARHRALFARAIARSLEVCVALQREAIEREQPALVIGSSWGGAVAAELIIRGAWSGPTVLLAPAIERVAAWTSTDPAGKVAAVRARGEKIRMLVFHDPADETIPHADSVELVRDSRIELRTVRAGGHRLMGLLDSGELATAIEQLVR